MTIPKNWVEISIRELTQVVAGGTPSTSRSEYFDGDISWITPADLSGYKSKYISRGRRNLTELGLNNSSAKLLPKNTILFSSRAPIGYVAIAENELSTNQGFKNLLPNQYYDPSYAYYYLKHIKNFAESQASGTTFKELSSTKMGSLPFLLPPLEEQKRISRKLDEIFNHIDELKFRLEKFPEIIKAIKGKILIDAVTGKLTEKWREKDFGNRNKEKPSEITSTNEVKFDVPTAWSWVELDMLCNKITDGEHITPPLSKSGVPLLSAKDVRDTFLDFSDVKYVSEIVAIKSRSRCNPERGDVLVVSRGATVGRSCVVTIDEIFCLMGSVLLFKPKKELIKGEYLNLYFKSAFGLEDIVNRSGATAQQAVYIRDMRNFKVPLPPIEEQAEIVSIVNRFFSMIEIIANQFIEIESKISELPEVTLIKAFKGELVKQIDDESATELLLQIKTQASLQKFRHSMVKSKSKDVQNQNIRQMELVDFIRKEFKTNFFSYEELDKKLNHISKKEYLETKKKFFELLRNEKYKTKDVQLVSEIQKGSGIVVYKLKEI